MPTTIGQWALQLVANPLGLTAGLASGQKSISSFTDSAAKKLQGISGGGASAGLKSIVSGLGSDLEKALKNPFEFGTTAVTQVLDGISSKIKEIPKYGKFAAIPFQALSATIGILGTSASMLFDTFDKGSKRIKELGAAAAQMSIPLNDFQTLMMVAGPNTEGMQKALFKLQQNLGSAAMGGKDATASLSLLGLKAQDLAGKATIDQFGLIADRLNLITDAGLRNKIAFELFGKAGKEALLAISKGSAGLAKQSDLRDQLGLGVTDANLDMIRKAGEAQKILKMASEGLTNQITLGLAPIMMQLSDVLVKLTGGAGAFSGALDGSKGSMSAVASATFAFAETVGLSFAAIIDWGRSLVVEMYKTAGVIALLNGDAIGAAVNFKKAMDLAANPSAFDTALGFFADAADRIDELFKDPPVPYDDNEIEDIKKLKKEWGSVYDDLGPEIDDIVKKNDEMKKAIKDAADANMWAMWAERAQKAFDSLNRPATKFYNSLDELNQLWAARMATGVGGKLRDVFTEDVYFQSLAQNWEKFASSVKLPEIKHAGALEQGSKEAYSAILKYTTSGQGMSVQERIQQVLLESKLVQEQQVQNGREIAQALKNLEVKGI